MIPTVGAAVGLAVLEAATSVPGCWLSYTCGEGESARLLEGASRGGRPSVRELAPFPKAVMARMERSCSSAFRTALRAASSIGCHCEWSITPPALIQDGQPVARIVLRLPHVRGKEIGKMDGFRLKKELEASPTFFCVPRDPLEECGE